MAVFWFATTLLCALGWGCMWVSRNNHRWRAEAAERKLQRTGARVYQLEQQAIRSEDPDELWARAQGNDLEAQAELEDRMFAQLRSHLSQQDGDGWIA